METDTVKFFLRRFKGILLPLVILVGVFFLTQKFLYPKVVQILKFHQQLKKNESQVLDLEKKATFLEKQKNDGLFANFEKAEQVLPSEKDVAGLLVSLEGIKESSNLQFGRFNLKVGLLATDEAKLKTQEPKEFEFRMTVSGPYDELIGFLERVEKTAPLVSIENAQVTFLLAEDDVKANLTLKAYYLPLKESAKIEKSLPELSSSLSKTLEKLNKFEVFNYTTFLPEEKIGKDNPFSY